MNEAVSLWALPPEMIAEVLRRQSVAGLLPEALRALSGTSAKAPADPVRDGGTMVIPVQGVVTPKGYYGGTSLERLGDQVRAAAADDKVGVIVLNIYSPGGSVYGTQEAADAIFEARAVKPVVAVANPLAASAAYWLGSQASAFYASPSADVGSVGVYAGHTDESGFEEKIGMKTTLIASDDSPKKVAGNPYEPLSDEARADVQASVNESMAAFVAAIARGRGVPAAKVLKDFGHGDVLSAPRALSAGMIDGVMTLRDVVAKYGSSRNRLALMRRRAEANLALHSI